MLDCPSAPLVSVIIPTRNAGPGFSGTLEAIHTQQVTGAFEIVAVDSGSTDGTPDICRQFSVQVVPIDPQTFNHGATRNLGIERSRGQYILLTVQDARPANDEWMQALVDALESDPQAAGTYSRQLPHPEDNYLIKFLTEFWFRAQGEKRVTQAIDSIEAFRQMPYTQRRMLCGFDNVSSMIRRSVWDRFRFAPMQFAEDIEWACRVMCEGYHIIYEPASLVIHSHDRSFGYNVRRHYIDSRMLMRILGADVASLRSWTHPLAALPLARMILRDAAAHRALDLPLLGKVSKYVLAVIIGTGLRRMLYPRVDEPTAPGWMRRVDSWLMRGI